MLLRRGEGRIIKINNFGGRGSKKVAHHCTNSFKSKLLKLITYLSKVLRNLS